MFSCTDSFVSCVLTLEAIRTERRRSESAVGVAEAPGSVDLEVGSMV